MRHFSESLIMRRSSVYILIAVGLLILYIAPLAYMWQRFAKDHTQINVLDYGAVGDGVTDDGPAFAEAFNDAAKYAQPVIIPRKTYVINRTMAITSGLIIRSDGAIIKHTDDSLTMFDASHVDDWILEGPLTLEGMRSEPNESGMETGLSILNASRYSVDKLTVKNFKNAGILIDANAAYLIPRDHGKFAFITFTSNHIGLQIHAGTGAEYNLFSLLSFTGNDVAADIAAGNTIISTSNIVDNANGLQLSGGSNDGHGIISAANINHNPGFNISAQNITNGYSFDACHIYGDSVHSGIIDLQDSKGIHFMNGTIDAAVIANGGGLNIASGNYIPAANFTVSGDHASSFNANSNFTAKAPLNGPSKGLDK